MDKKYQVFVSSTYVDLKEERNEAAKCILELGHIPAAMEAFASADEEQFQYIKTIIDQCDYYVLIVAGRYGSTGPEGKSYTELEFDYAREKGIPVLAFVYKNVAELSVAKSEKTPAAQKRLEVFRKRVCSGRIVKFWSDMTELKSGIGAALYQVMSRHPGVGWVRGNVAAANEILQELNEIRKENDLLREQLLAAKSNSSVIIEGIKDIDSEILLKYLDSNGSFVKGMELKISWREIFEILYEGLKWPTKLAYSGSVVSSVIRNLKFPHTSAMLSRDQQQKIIHQLLGLGLIEKKFFATTDGTRTFYAVSPLGERVYLERRVDRAGVS